jgi:hypothetical protein
MRRHVGHDATGKPNEPAPPWPPELYIPRVARHDGKPGATAPQALLDG